MAKRNPSAPGQRMLRRYALAGQWDMVRRLLGDRLRQNPQDEEARQELQRLDKGESLQATETAGERRKRLAETACDNIRRMVETLPDSKLRTLSVKQLKQNILQLRDCRRLMLDGDLTPLPAIETFLAKLKKEYRRRSTWRMRRAALWMVGAALAGGMAWLAADGLRLRAVSLEEELAKSLKKESWAGVRVAVDAADTGIYRLLCPGIADRIADARKWLARQQASHDRIAGQLQLIESDRQSVASLGLSRRAALEKELRSLPKDLNDLATRWQKLCERERSQLASQKAALISELTAPLPPPPDLQNTPGQDAPLLRAQLAQLEPMSQSFEDACAMYGLDPKLAEPLKERLAYLRDCLEDIEALRAFAAMLPYARSYGQYRRWLEQFSPKAYPPALQIALIREHLPSEDHLKDLMQDPAQSLPNSILDAAREAIINKGSSFSPLFPANQIQVALMEDPFTADSLRRRLIELTLSDGRVFYTEQQPDISPEGVTFKLSPLDPSFVAGERNMITWREAHGVWKRAIDTRGLTRAGGVERASFFRDGNVPQLLTSVLQYRDPHCPALAQACLYHRLLQVMQEHDYPIMMGIGYAPTLRADARSFLILARKLGIGLEPGCWLGNSPAQRKAEVEFARWFRRHRHHDYAKEIARNFSDLVNIRPCFCGYIDEKREPVLCRALRKGTLIWHIGKNGVTVSRLGTTPDEPAVFSPVFTVERPRN